jgi:acylphosphatase
MDTARISCIVHGCVQGVAFRTSAQQQARRLRLVGWVRNRADGTVEMLAEGERIHLHQLVDWCYQGPPAARVTRVEVQWAESEGTLSGFEIRF